MNLSPEKLVKTANKSRFSKFLAKYFNTVDTVDDLPSDPPIGSVQAIYSSDDPVTGPITITDAQIKALPTTAIELVPAPGAGLMIAPFMAFVRCDFQGGAYTNLSLVERMFYIDGANQPIILGGFNDLDNDVLAHVDDVAMIIFTPQATVASAATFATWAGEAVGNEGLRFRITNTGSGNLTGGNAANTMKVTVLYTLIEV